MSDPANLITRLVSAGLNPGTAKYLVSTRAGQCLSQLEYNEFHKDQRPPALRNRIETAAPAPAAWVDRHITKAEEDRRERARVIVEEYREGKRAGLDSMFTQIEDGLAEPIKRMRDGSIKRRIIDSIAKGRILETL